LDGAAIKKLGSKAIVRLVAMHSFLLLLVPTKEFLAQTGEWALHTDPSSH
jgi:hypothetical protein